MEYVKLSNGVEMPMLGLGVFQIPDHDEAKRVVSDALEVGYRLIDTAQAYMNERAVGEAVRESGLSREDVFVTSKVWVQDYTYEKTLAAVDRSLERLGTDHLDLMLLHQPIGDYHSAWRALERAYADGKLRAIGMANCYPHVLADICETVDIRPMVDQVEMHPFFQQTLNLDTMKEYGVVPEAWAPFNEGKRDFFRDPVLTAVGEKYGKTAAQVALRWNIQRGVVVIPKTVHKERMQQNAEVFDFALSDEDMTRIAAMDIGHSEIVDHFDPKWIAFLHTVRC